MGLERYEVRTTVATDAHEVGDLVSFWPGQRRYKVIYRERVEPWGVDLTLRPIGPIESAIRAVYSWVRWGFSGDAW